MLLIVGLGNPGKKYQNTRHNIGFRIINELQKKNNFPAFKLSKNFDSLVSQGLKIILIKPETFMNLSGKAVSKIAQFYKINPQKIVVIHDDIDLFLGKIKIVKNRGTGGHKGIESIVKEIKTKNFVRIRIGIQPETGKLKNTKKLVLEKFSKKEEKIVEETTKKAVEIIKFLLENNFEKTQNTYNSF